MELLRRIPRSGKAFAAALAATTVSLMFLLLPHTARACWNTVLSDCFDIGAPNWPNTGWAVSSNQSSRWGIESRYFDTHVCQNDQHAVWILGNPTTNDPQFTPYPPNLDTYMTYGPVNLAGMTAGAASFWLLNSSESGHDSIFWGASLSPNLTAQNMMIAGTYSGDVELNWNIKYVDFAQLRTPAGDTISYLGQSAVWVFWRFRSDGNANPPDHQPLRFGAIVDNVTISRDDGGVNITALPPTLLNPDSSLCSHPLPGFPAWASFSWTTCSGGEGVYPPFRIMSVVDTLVVLDTVISNATSGMNVTMGTHLWTLWPDSHQVRIVIDTLNDVQETNENDNVGHTNFWVPPYHNIDFQWLTPGDGIEYGDQSVMLRWTTIPDTNAPATVTVSSSLDDSSCTGIPIQGGNNRPVLGGPDSLLWNISAYVYGSVRHPFVKWHDAYHEDSCIYAPYPVIREISAVGERMGNAIPEHFYLAQNYPNPFNPTTELRYGITRAGHVTLTVFDVLGREVAVMVNGERSPGIYALNFDGSALSSGLYFCKLTTPEGVQTRKMMLMK
jgi:hypothetical protein